MSKVYFKDAFFKKNLMDKYSGQRREVQSLEGIVTKTRILRQYMASRDVSLEAIRELYRLIPQEIYLTSINVDGAGSLSIQGVSDSMSQVFTFVTALESSPLFEGVKTKSTAAKKDRGKDVATFEIIMNLTDSNGESEDKPAQTPAVKKESKPVKQGAVLDQ
jgi:Tfp pilus assembly protein PilN